MSPGAAIGRIGNLMQTQLDRLLRCIAGAFEIT